MSDNGDQQTRQPDDRPEYYRFLALLVVFGAVIVAAAAMSPRLITEVAPAVLGLSNQQEPATVPDDEDQPATEEVVPAPQMAPAVETELEAAPETLTLQHEVQEGQTLHQLAEYYGVSVQELAAVNNLVSASQLQPGTVLIIPTGP